jgi:hypothetical protein
MPTVINLETHIVSLFWEEPLDQGSIIFAAVDNVESAAVAVELLLAQIRRQEL